jgi:hypothetical protein
MPTLEILASKCALLARFFLYFSVIDFIFVEWLKRSSMYGEVEIKFAK